MGALAESHDRYPTPPHCRAVRAPFGPAFMRRSKLLRPACRAPTSGAPSARSTRSVGGLVYVGPTELRIARTWVTESRSRTVQYGAGGGRLGACVLGEAGIPESERVLETGPRLRTEPCELSSPSPCLDPIPMQLVMNHSLAVQLRDSDDVPLESQHHWLATRLIRVPLNVHAFGSPLPSPFTMH